MNPTSHHIDANFSLPEILGLKDGRPWSSPTWAECYTKGVQNPWAEYRQDSSSSIDCFALPEKELETQNLRKSGHFNAPVVVHRSSFWTSSFLSAVLFELCFMAALCGAVTSPQGRLHRVSLRFNTIDGCNIAFGHQDSKSKQECQRREELNLGQT